MAISLAAVPGVITNRTGTSVSGQEVASTTSATAGETRTTGSASTTESGSGTATYYSNPYYKVDYLARLTIMAFRNPETGAVIDQIPPAKVVEEYRKAALALMPVASDNSTSTNSNNTGTGSSTGNGNTTGNNGTGSGTSGTTATGQIGTVGTSGKGAQSGGTPSGGTGGGSTSLPAPPVASPAPRPASPAIGSVGIAVGGGSGGAHATGGVTMVV